MMSIRIKGMARRASRTGAVSLCLLLAASAAQMHAAVRVAEASDPYRAASPAAASGAAAEVAQKSETVYARLDASGAPRSAHVVNHFVVAAAGSLTDTGDYSAVKNLSTTDAISKDGQAVSVGVDAGDFYYEGTLAEPALPWDVKIDYLLNGTPRSADALAGGSGNMEIAIHIAQNGDADPLFFENYLLQVQLTLNASRTHDIQAEGATIAASGASHQAVFTVLPGRTADLSLKAEVTDFEMPGIQISALPFNMAFDLPDTSELELQMTQLSDAVAALNSGMADLAEGIEDISGGTSLLANGSSAFASGLSAVSSGSEGLTGASAQIDASLAFISQQLAAGSIDPSQIASLVQALEQLSLALSNNSGQGSAGAAQALAGLSSALNTAVSGMDAALADPSGVALDPAAVAALSQDPAYGAQFASYYLSSQSWMQGAWQTWHGVGGAGGGVRDALTQADAALASLSSSLTSMAAQTDAVAQAAAQAQGSLQSLTQLAAGISLLSSEYSQFNTALGTYAAGVDALAAGYPAADSALAQLSGGSSTLAQGALALYAGTATLHASTADLPQQMQEQISEFTASYSSKDFQPASFTSSSNASVKLVQFVLVSDPISKPLPAESPSEAVQSEASILSRLLKLFGFDD